MAILPLLIMLMLSILVVMLLRGSHFRQWFVWAFPRQSRGRAFVNRAPASG
jgi:predicted PurR-regulated permease PerM